jgi:hypothetical protein
MRKSHLRIITADQDCTKIYPQQATKLYEKQPAFDVSME